MDSKSFLVQLHCWIKVTHTHTHTFTVSLSTHIHIIMYTTTTHYATYVHKHPEVGITKLCSVSRRVFVKTILWLDHTMEPSHSRPEVSCILPW